MPRISRIFRFRYRFRFRFRYRFRFRFRYRFRFRFLVAHPGARTWCHALPWWAVCCSYPRGLQQPKQNNTQIMKYAPAKGVEPSQVHAGHGMG